MQTVSIVIPTAPSLVQGSPTSSENTSKKRQLKLTTQYQKLSEKPLSGISNLSEDERHFLVMVGKTNEQFVEYIDYTFRKSIIGMFEQNNRSMSRLDIDSAWAEVVLCAWRNGVVAEEYKSWEHLSRWCYSTMRTYARWHRSHDTQNRAHRSGEHVFNTVYMSDLDDEILNRTLESMTAKSQQEMKPRMGLSIGWLTEAMDNLSKLQRTSVVGLKIMGLSREETADLIPTTVSSVRGAMRAGVNKIVKAAPEEYQELRRQKVARYG